MLFFRKAIVSSTSDQMNLGIYYQRQLHFAVAIVYYLLSKELSLAKISIKNKKTECFFKNHSFLFPVIVSSRETYVQKVLFLHMSLSTRN